MSDYGTPFQRLARAVRDAARQEARSEHGVQIRGQVLHVTPLRVSLPSRGVTLEAGADDFEITSQVASAAAVGDGVLLLEREEGWIATALLKE